MDFSFIESFFADPVVIQGVVIPGIFITLELLLAVYIMTKKGTKLKIRMFLYMNKVASFTLFVFISIVTGSANSYIVMHILPDFCDKSHPFIYFLITNKEFENTKIEKLNQKILLNFMDKHGTSRTRVRFPRKNSFEVLMGRLLEKIICR